MVLKEIRCSNQRLCKNRIIGKASVGSTVIIKCPRCGEYHTETVK